MTDELKVRVHDYQRVEAELVARGGVFREERHIVDTYFHQPVPHAVKKIQHDERGHWLVELTPHHGKFAIVKFDKLDDPDPLYAQLTRELGVMSILRKRCRFFDWGDYVVDINLIEGYGDFLVITGAAPTLDMLRPLGITNPEHITVPFNELPRLGAAT